MSIPFFIYFFFINHTLTLEIYTLSLHDALPISHIQIRSRRLVDVTNIDMSRTIFGVRSEEHTSELQSLTNIVCRLLLEKKKKFAESNSVSYIIIYVRMSAFGHQNKPVRVIRAI